VGTQSPAAVRSVGSGWPVDTGYRELRGPRSQQLRIRRKTRALADQANCCPYASVTQAATGVA
jgi:hypothetical protein